MKEYTVTCTEMCPECNGSRVATNHLWVELNNAIKEAEKHSDVIMVMPKLGYFMNDWARNHGYENVDALGPEEFECSECGGAGKIISHVPLIAALRELGVGHCLELPL